MGFVNPLNPKRVSVLVINWNTRDLLRACLHSIDRTVGFDSVHCIVVDNASDDHSAAMVREEFPQVELISSQANLGFSRANNLAYTRTVGDLILLLNPDAELHDHSLDQLVIYLDEHPKAGMVGPRLVNPDGSLQVSAHPFPTLFRETWRLFHLDAWIALSKYPTAFWQSTTAQPVDVLMGACILLRRQAVPSGTFFDEQFFIYSEEVDLCKRVKSEGWGISYLPTAVVTHHGAQSTRQVPEAMFLELYKNKIKYFRKHHGEPATRMYKVTLLLASALRILAAWFTRSSQMEQQYKSLLRNLSSF